MISAETCYQNIIRYYLLPNSTVLKICLQEYEYVAIQK